jgi:hypothetical protein
LSRKPIIRRSRESATGFSLFPFLAVLLCTMGALIMLLVLIARNVQEQNTVLAAAELPADNTEERLQTLQIETEDAEWLADELLKSKKIAEDKLAEERAKLATVEKETQKIRDELARLETIVKELDANTTATPQQRDELKRLLAQKNALREQTENELRKLQEELEKNAKSYAIIPHRGAGGTNRRPIYIECTKDKVIIQPEGIVLEGFDFAAPDRPDNPVDAAVRAIRQYYGENGLLPQGTEPYPLFIVRPSGVEVYDAVRACLGTWVNESGYELVDEDWNVEYPPSNAAIKERVEKQVEVSRQRIGGYIAAMEMQRRQAERQQFRVDSKGSVQPLPTPGGQRYRMPNTIEPSAPSPPYTSQQPQRTDDTISLDVPDPPQKNLAASPREAQPSQPQQPQQPPVITSPNASRGENWALKGARRNAMAVSRSIKIQIEPDRLVLVQQPGLMFAQVIPIGNSVALAIDNLVEAVNEFTESWETAGENSYWKPTLKVKVLPGGEERFNDFQLLLRGSGLVVEKQ